MALTLGSWPQATGFDTASYMARMQELFQFMIPDGVLPSRDTDIYGTYSHEFLPFGDSSGMQVKVYQGRMITKGLFAKINDADAGSGFYALPVTAAHATLYRIDRVIIRFNLNTGVAVLMMLDGTAAALASVAPTALTATLAAWDVELAQVFVAPAVVTITANDVQDTRTFSQTLNEMLRVKPVPSMIINGFMNLAQRPFSTGSTYSSVADSTYTLDRYLYGKVGAVVHDIIQSTDVPAIVALVPGNNFSLHLDVTTADASVAASDQCYIEQRVEGYNWYPYAQKQWTLGFWVKQAIVGKHAVAIRNLGTAGAADRSCVMEYEQYAADTWEWKNITIPASPVGGTWNYTSSIGLKIAWTQYAGTNFGTAPGVWQTGNFLVAFNADGTTVRTVNEVNSTANNFKLFGVKTALGNYVSPYPDRLYSQELALAVPYYELLGGAASVGVGAGPVFAATVSEGMVPYSRKRGIPGAVNVINATDFMINDTSVSRAVASFGFINLAGVLMARYNVTAATGLTPGRNGTLFPNTTAGKIEVISEI